MVQLGFIQKLLRLRLRLRRALRRLGCLEGKERFVNSGGDLVHPRLQMVQIFMKSGIDDFIDTRE